LTLAPNWRNPIFPSAPFPRRQLTKRKVFISYHHERDQSWLN
jgi:hypothetical protein